MPAEVETMFSARKVPWHGLGTITTEALNADEALVTAGIDWEVRVLPVKVRLESGKYTESKRDRAVVREGDDSILGVVGNRYVPVQNREAFQFVDNLLDTGDVKFETAGSLREGRTTWMLANVGPEIEVAGDRHYPYLLLSNSFDGRSPVVAAMTVTRVVCANTHDFALRGAQSTWKIRHTASALNRIDEARRTLGLAYSYLDEFQAEVEKMIETQVTDDQFEQLVATLLPIDDEKSEGWQERTLQQQGEIKTLWFQSPTIGDFRGTAWGAVNAFSEWEQWLAPIRTKSNRAEVLADRTLRRTVMPMGKQVHKALVAAKVRNG